MIGVAMIALMLAGGLSYSLALVFLVVMIVSWMLERTKWQLPERIGLAIVLLSIPLFYVDWQYQKFLGEPVIGFVPSDYQMAVTSINLGRPLVLSDPHSRIAQEIRRVTKTVVTGQMVAREEPQPRRTMWNSLFKREPASSRTPNKMKLQVSGPDVSL